MIPIVGPCRGPNKGIMPYEISRGERRKAKIFCREVSGDEKQWKASTNSI